jgi:hypothetical protein
VKYLTFSSSVEVHCFLASGCDGHYLLSEVGVQALIQWIPGLKSLSLNHRFFSLIRLKFLILTCLLDELLDTKVDIQKIEML